MDVPSTGPAAALARGWAVFPIPSGQKIAPPGWQARASSDPGQSWPAGSNIGVGCRASRLVVLDLDRKDGLDGVAQLAALAAEQGRAWPDTFTVVTPSGGQHLYFTAPAWNIVNTIKTFAAGIDVRAPGRVSGGYVVGPGSMIGGRAYTISDGRPVAELPGWICRRLRATAASRAGGGSPRRSSTGGVLIPPRHAGPVGNG